ncbi:MAG TPA: hypothetical protein V6D15_19945 [Oculatellaceae cyanobacterium]|jgi:hypothetical protein
MQPKSVGSQQSMNLEDVVRPSPLGHSHINILGRYHINILGRYHFCLHLAVEKPSLAEG